MLITYLLFHLNFPHETENCSYSNAGIYAIVGCMYSWPGLITKSHCHSLNFFFVYFVATFISSQPPYKGMC